MTGRRTHLLVLIAYALLSLALTYPVITDPASLVPGSNTWAYDEYTFLWNTWWLKHSVLDLGVSPLHTDMTFHPVGVPLVLYTFNFTGSALGLPVYLAAANLPLATNVVLWAMLALSGYCTYLLTRYLVFRLTGRAAGAAAQVGPFVAGLAFAFPASRFVYLALGHYIYVLVATLPLFAYFALRALDEPARWRRYAVLAGLAFALTTLVEMTLGLLMVILLLVLAAFRWRGLGPRRLVARLGLTGAASALFYGPLLVPVIRETFRGSYSIVGWGDALRLSADLVGLFTPTALHPLWGADWVQHLRSVATGTGRFSDVHTLFLGYGALALAAIGAIAYARRALPWLITALGSVILALGPLLQINGHHVFDLDGITTTVPLPFIVLHYIPLVSAGRAPNRFSVLAVMALAPLVGLGVYWFASHYRRWWMVSLVGTAAALAILWDGLSLPLPTTDASVPAFYASLAQEEGDFSILTLPFGVRSSFGTLGAERTQLQYYQTVHGKRIIGGNISRAPDINFDYYRNAAPLARLLAVESYQDLPPMSLEEERRLAAELATLLDLRFVVVHAPIPGRLPYADTYDEAFAYVSRIFDLTEVYRDREGKLVAYRVARTGAPDDVSLKLNDSSQNMYLGQGWSHPETIAGVPGRWIEGTTAVVYLPVGEPSEPERVLRFTAAPFTFPGAPNQIMTVYVNGQRVSGMGMAPGWQQYTVSVPRSAFRSGLNRVEIRLSHAHRPVDVLAEGYYIGGTGLRAPVHLEANSRPELAYITVGTEDGSRHAEGINLALFHPQSGALVATASFGWAEGAQMEQFLERAQPGTGVIVAVRGGVPSAPDEGICRALQRVGATWCPPAGSSGYVLMGKVGATAGSALEGVGDQAYLRLSPDTRSLSAAFSEFTLQSLP
ncbi:MAG: interleukin-like EMT inducer domain-containing protein [Anaerolineae bacterium]